MKYKLFRKRVYPTLLLKDRTFVKSRKFKDFTYIGNPLNTIQIFNEIGVDEISILDINAHLRGIDFDYIEDLASEAFIPVSYGGGIRSIDDVSRIIDCGVEKIILSYPALKNPSLIQEISNKIGSSSTIFCLNFKKSFIFSGYRVFDHSRKRSKNRLTNDFVKKIISYGVGEIILQSVSNDGCWNGFPIDNLSEKGLFNDVTVPLIFLGGIGSIKEINELLDYETCSAVSISSLALFQRKNQGVVISFPTNEEIING